MPKIPEGKAKPLPARRGGGLTTVTVAECIARLEDLADWLDEQYPNEAAALRTVADDLKGYTPGAAAG